MPWEIDRKRNLLQYVVDDQVARAYPAPRNAAEALKLLARVAGTEATRDEITLLIILLAGTCSD